MTTPSGKSVCSATRRPMPRGVPRRVRRRLEDHGVAGGEGLPELVEDHLNREVPGHERAHDPDRLLPDLTRVGRAPAVDDLAQVGPPGKLVNEFHRVAQRAVERDVELVGVRGHPRAAHLEDELLPQLFAVLLECLLQLGEAALAQFVVGGPVGLVEGAPGAVDGPVHVGARPVGHLSEDLLGGGVDVVEGPARGGLHELAVDQHPLFVADCFRHARPQSVNGLSTGGNPIIKKCHEHNRAVVYLPGRNDQSGKVPGKVQLSRTPVPNRRVRTLPAPSSWSSTIVRRTKRWSGCSVVKPMPASTC